ncbi:MAG: Hpt domain-containing protein [Candidatus Gastranaerophilaceae bacterium]
MDFLPEEFEEILNIFRGETEEIIQKLNNNLLQLENSPNNKDLIVYLFRDAHSLKGAARMIGFNNIQRLAHKAEDVLGLAKENKIVINREISDALYKAMDLLSDLIQESVKLKKEYYTDDIQKIIDYIDELTEKYQGQSVEESKNITQNEQNKEITTNPKTQNQDFLKTTITINALLSEAYLLLKNMQGEEGSSYIETFCDVIKQLDEKFEETNFYEIKNEIKNIFAKVDFVIKSSNLMTDDEIKDIDNKLTNTVNFLNKIYENLGIEKIDVKEKVSQKIQQDKDNAKDKQNKNQTSAHSDTLNNLAEKIEFLKEGFNKFESDLSQVPQLYDEIKSLVEITNKKEIKQICDKIMEILAIVKKGKTLPDKEIITILKQSLLSVEKLTLETKEEQDDVTLVLQRLDIIKQMMDLNSSVNPLSNLAPHWMNHRCLLKRHRTFSTLLKQHQ